MVIDLIELFGWTAVVVVIITVIIVVSTSSLPPMPKPPTGMLASPSSPSPYPSPSPSATSSASSSYFIKHIKHLKPHETVTCGDAMNYRYVGNNKIRLYPSDAIMNSYPDSTIPREIDCTGMIRGDAMTFNWDTLNNSYFYCDTNGPRECQNQMFYADPSTPGQLTCLDSVSPPGNAINRMETSGIDCAGMGMTKMTKMNTDQQCW